MPPYTEQTVSLWKTSLVTTKSHNMALNCENVEILVYILENTPFSPTAFIVNIQPYTGISMLAYCAVTGRRDAVMYLLGNPNWDWGLEREKARDMAKANGFHEIAADIQQHINTDFSFPVFVFQGPSTVSNTFAGLGSNQNEEPDWMETDVDPNAEKAGYKKSI